MRISTAHSYDASLDSLTRRQSEMTAVMEQATTDKRVNRASDDPTAAGRAERALSIEKRIDATQRAVDASENAVRLSESALGDAGELLQQVRETVVSAGNASYSDAERKGLATKISGLRNQLLAVANRNDGAGNYLFGGQGASQAPFLDAPGGVAFRGVEGQIDAASGETLPLTVDGSATWLSARTGNGVFVTSPDVSNGSAWIDSGHVTDAKALTGSAYSVEFDVTGGVTTYSVLQDGAGTSIAGQPFRSGQAIEIDGISVNITGQPADGDKFDMKPSTADLNVFNVLDKTIVDLLTPQRSGAQITQSNSQNLTAIDAVSSQMQNSRTQLGETLNRIESVTGRLADSKLASQTDRSHAEDADLVQVYSEFQSRQTGYDAALKSYSMVQKMSLFNYISA